MATWMLCKKGLVRHLQSPLVTELYPGQPFSVCGARLDKDRTTYWAGMDMLPQLGFRKCQRCERWENKHEHTDGGS